MSKILIGGHEITVHKDYSTSEVFTGQYWIDGKKIYRKVFTGTIPTLTANTSSVIILDASFTPSAATVLSYSGFVDISTSQRVILPQTGGQPTVISGTTYLICPAYVWCDQYTGGLRLIILVMNATQVTAYSGKSFTLSFEYTKTE